MLSGHVNHLRANQPLSQIWNGVISRLLSLSGVQLNNRHTPRVVHQPRRLDPPDQVDKTRKPMVGPKCSDESDAGLLV